MLRSFVRGALEFRFLVLVIACVTMIAGIVQFREMPLDVLPEFSPTYVEIQTEALGLSAKEVEQLITVPMEQDLLIGVPWLDTIASKSVPGLSSIVLNFQPGINLNQARQMVAERLTQAVALPHVSKPPTMLQPLSSAARFMIIGLSSKDMSLMEMSVLTRWTIAPRLLSVPGVANVAIWGQRNRELQVQIDPSRLQAQGVTLQDVLETTGNALWVSSLSFLEASTPGTGGFIDTPNQRIGVWHVLPISSAKDLAEVPIEDRGGILLGDAASVVEGHQPLIGDASSNQGPSLLVVLEKLPGTNVVEVTQGVEKAIEALQPGMTSIAFDTSLFRPTAYVDNAVTGLATALIISFLLVNVTLALLIYEWRAVLIGIVSITLSLVAAVLVLSLRGSPLNMLVFAGLAAALGVVIDDGIHDVDNIVRRMRQSREAGDNKSLFDIVVESATEVRGRIIFATVIVVLTVLPVFLLGGQTGLFFQPLAVSYVLAVLASMVVSITVTPALGTLLLGGAPLRRRESPVVVTLQAAYHRLLNATVQKPMAAFAIIAVSVIIGALTVPALVQDFVPAFKERDVLIRVDAAAGTSLPEMNRITARLSEELRKTKGVRNVGVHVGRAILGDQVVGINSGVMWLNIDAAADYDATMADIAAVVNSYPGLSLKVQTYSNQQSSGILESAPDPLVVRVFGENLDTLRAKADEVHAVVSGVSGVSNARLDAPVEEPTFEIGVDLAAAQRYGIKPGDVRRAAAVLLSGIQVGNLFEGQKVFDVVVWGTPQTRHSMTSIHDMLLDTPGGGHVRLGDVAKVSIKSVPNIIRRQGASPFIDISVAIQGRDLAAVTNDIQAAIRKLQFPLEYHTEVIRARAKEENTQQRVLGGLVVVLLATFFLQQAVFQRWNLATLAFLILPLAVVGGLVAVLVFDGGNFSLGAAAGVLTILGITMRNGVALVGHFQYLEQTEGHKFGLELVLRGCKERFVPIAATLLATALAVVPFIVFGSVPGFEIVRSMAIFVLGGLVSSALIILVVMPALYLRFGAGAIAPFIVESHPAAHAGLAGTR